MLLPSQALQFLFDDPPGFFLAGFKPIRSVVVGSRALGLGGDSLRLEMQAGLIPVRAQGDRWTLTAPTPTWRELEEPRAALAEALGLKETDISDRPLWIKAGKEQLIVPLTSSDAVRRAAPQPEPLRRIRSEDGIGMAYVFNLESSRTALARFFFPQGPAVLEDPATGSATANFGGWCLATEFELPVEHSRTVGPG